VSSFQKKPSNKAGKIRGHLNNFPTVTAAPIDSEFLSAVMAMGEVDLEDGYPYGLDSSFDEFIDLLDIKEPPRKDFDGIQHFSTFGPEDGWPI